MPDVGYYTLPVILTFQGIDKAVNAELGDKLKPAAKRAGEDYARKASPKASSPAKATSKARFQPGLTTAATYRWAVIATPSSAQSGRAHSRHMKPQRRA